MIGNDEKSVWECILKCFSSFFSRWFAVFEVTESWIPGLKTCTLVLSQTSVVENVKSFKIFDFLKKLPNAGK